MSQKKILILVHNINTMKKITLSFAITFLKKNTQNIIIFIQFPNKEIHTLN